MNKLLGVFIFAAGAAVGSVVTWKLLKTKYERIAQEEIDSVKEAFSQRVNSDDNDIKNDTEKDKDKIEDDDEEYFVRVNDLGYTRSSVPYVNEVKKKGGGTVRRPYVITPDEFGEIYEYDTISLRYYADKVLTDEDDVIITNVDEIIGEDSLTHFGEYEDDSVFVRNDEMKADYEILLDLRKYYDINEPPRQVD